MPQNGAHWFDDVLMLGSMSLILNIPDDKYIVHDVSMPSTCDSCHVYYAIRDELKIAWYNLDGVLKQPYDTLITLTLEAIDEEDYNSIEGISINGNSVITDTAAIEYTDVRLLQPRIVIVNSSVDKPRIFAMPNPSSNEVVITYQIPEEGDVSIKIFDAYGREVAVLVDSRQISDVYRLKYDVSNLPAGFYTYGILFNGQLITRKLIITH